MSSAERGERAIKDGEGKECEGGKDAPLELAGCPEDLAIAEGVEPQQVDPKGEQGSRREQDHQDDEGDYDEKYAVARPR